MHEHADAARESRAEEAVESPATSTEPASTPPPAADAAADAQAGSTEQPAEPAPPVKGPKLVRRVVCSYQTGWLPGDWLQTWRRLDRIFDRANLKVKATLAPLEDLPEDTDILVVPPELREAARQAARPGTPILVTPASSAAGAFADLVERLQAATEFSAEPLTEADREAPRIVTYRGHTLLD